MISFIMATIDHEDDQAFMLWLYQEFKDIMLSTAKKYISDPEDQEDVVQDSIIKLIKKISVLRGKERCILCAYVVYTVRNTAINHLRHKAVEKAHFEDLDDGIEHEANLLSLDDLMTLKERDVRVFELLERLDEAERVILIGKYILENTDEELAAQLNCKPSSIRMKLTRARRKALELFYDDEVINHDKA